MRNRIASAFLASLALAGCKAVPEGRPPRSTPPPTNPVNRPAPVPEAQVMREAGLEGVIGANAGQLVRMFGQPRLDLTEGDVHKLQFKGPPCVLDVYLYPPAQGRGEPQATYVDARRASDGKNVDRAACVNALRRP